MPLRIECNHQPEIGGPEMDGNTFSDDLVHTLGATTEHGFVPLGWAQGHSSVPGGWIDGIELTQPGSTFTKTEGSIELRIISIKPIQNGRM